MSTSTSKTREAQVIAAGTSYFEVQTVHGPDGQPRRDQMGNEIQITVRHNAVRGDIVDLSEYEFNRLSALGAVREPSGESLFPPLQATPFGMPVVDPEDGFAKAAVGPIMGDPRPAGPDVDIATQTREGRPGTLTPEQRLHLERVAAGEIDLDGNEIEEEGLGNPEDHHLSVEAEQPGSGASRETVEGVGDPTTTTGGAAIPRPQGNDANRVQAIEGEYEDYSKSDLAAEVERRNASRPEDAQIEVEGTGQNGNVVKDDLVLALESDDQEDDQS